jgi:NDP-sugar pyrophosphorylase family protein
MNLIRIDEYISEFKLISSYCGDSPPWSICAQASEILQNLSKDLGSEYIFDNAIAIHKTAVVEKGVTFKGPTIVGKHSFVSANCYFRDGVFLGEGVKIGPSCEIKASFIFSNSAIAHFNYVGNSLIGSHVNLEAGVVLANHFNVRDNKEIFIIIGEKVQATGATKFGAVVGDNTKIGANSVTTPGTILGKNSIVERLTLVNQIKPK